MENRGNLCALFSLEKRGTKCWKAPFDGKLFHTPEGARVVGPLVVREMIYHLLKGSDGNAIRRFVRSGSKTHIISQCIYGLQSELTHDVDVPALAKAARMSRSAFFKHFKEVTALSPIQYQKRLRLLEARRTYGRWR